MHVPGMGGRCHEMEHRDEQDTDGLREIDQIGNHLT
jgi:hypothetical protein